VKFDELRTSKIKVRFAQNSMNIRRIELVRKFDRSPKDGGPEAGGCDAVCDAGGAQARR